MRKIKFLPDTGNMITLNAPENLTVEAFVVLLEAEGGQFDLNKNKLVDKKSKSEFKVADATLPEGDISLFSLIKDPKGNNLRAEVYTKIKELITDYGQRAKDHFSQYGNYTQVSTADLQNLIKSFKKGKKVVVKVSVSTKKTPAKKAVSKVSQEELELKAAKKAYVNTIG